MDVARRERLEATTRWDPGAVEARVFGSWLDERRLRPARRGLARGQLLDRDPAPERDRRAAHGPRAQRHDPGRARPGQPDAGPQHALGAGHRPRRDRDPGGGREGAPRARGPARHELGREAFVERVWEWRRRYGSRIVEQYKRLGASCDYERERFTLDEGYVRAVHRVFVAALREGLHLPRQLHGQLGPGDALGDLRPRGRATARSPTPCSRSTTRSRASDEALTVATVRPETMLADTAVAVNPDDERYCELGRRPLRSCRWSAAGCRSSPTTTSTRSSAPGR